MAQATLLFGVGAAKAGTSWLHRYLSVHPDVAMPEPKELHFFDALEFGTARREVNNAMRQIAMLESKIETVEDAARRRNMMRRHADLCRYAAFMAEDGLTTADYAGFMEEARGSKDIVGDITPAYALLPEARFAEMAALAPNTRFILLLRDPVDRAWSNIKFTAERQAKAADRPDQVERFAQTLLGRVLNGEARDVIDRSDYKGTLTRLFNAVPSAHILVEFYERLFDTATLERICAFLGIAPRAGETDLVVNKSVRMTLASDMKARLRDQLAPQYDYVADRFGAALPDAWAANMKV